MPGRSTTVISWPMVHNPSLFLSARCFILPSFFSTVTPGQLPTYSLLPVIALKSVVLPQFGLPASASLTGRSSSNVSLGQKPSFEHMLFSIMKPVSSAARLCSAWSASRLSALCSRSSRARFSLAAIVRSTSSCHFLWSSSFISTIVSASAFLRDIV